MFSRLSIRNKITIVIAFLLIAMTGMGLLAVSRMHDINAKAVEIQTNWLPSVRALGELRTGVMNYRSVLRGHLLSDTIEGKTAAEKRLETADANNNRIRQVYEKLITSPEERALIQDLHGALCGASGER